MVGANFLSKFYQDTEKASQEDTSSSRVSCLGFGSSLWYETDNNILNVGKSSKYFQKAKKNIKKYFKADLAAIATSLTNFALIALIGFTPLAATITPFVVIYFAIMVILALGIKQILNQYAFIINTVHTVYNSCRAQLTYKKIVGLGTAY